MESARLIETVKRAQNGDDEALLALYLDIHKSVYYLALKMMKSPNDAEDMTQDVYITIQEKIAGLQEPVAFYRWINQITANKCTSALRKRRELNGFDEDSDVWVQEENDHMLLPDKAFDDAEIRRLIMEVIDNLPVNQRVCVYFYYYEQLTISQIAETLETNENTVKSRLALARGKIKAELERKEREEGVRLYAVPLALTPILRQAMQEFTMPEGVAERMWENISRAAKSAPPDGSGSNPPDSSGVIPPGQCNPPASGAGGTSAINATGTAATGAGMALATKIIIGVVAATVVTAGAIIIPRSVEMPPDEAPLPAVTDTETLPDIMDTAIITPDVTGQIEQSELKQGEFAQNEDGIYEYETGGTYEGDMVDGVRSGWGIWVYEFWRYEGWWANDMPNGEGTLYCIWEEAPVELPNEISEDEDYGVEVVIRANFINGIADGQVSETWYMKSGREHYFSYEINQADGWDELILECSFCGNDGYPGLTKIVRDQIVGVPPWIWE